MPNPKIYRNLTQKDLIHLSIKNNEGVIASNGALVVTTGNRTGRSPHDRFIVQENTTSSDIDWGKVNQPFSEENFSALWLRAETYLSERPYYFESTLHVGASKQHFIPVKVSTQTAWHNLFAQNLFIHAKDYNTENKPQWHIINIPSFACSPERDFTNSDGCVLINFKERKVLIAGIGYAGEMKKAMFSVQNFLLPDQNILPMHCAANISTNGKVNLFFGLSGTGKTTLSADDTSLLIGDDEHGWGNGEVFNLEGGCYAKCIDLSRESEPVIWDAIREGSIIENVVLDDQMKPDYGNTSLTENTRAAYPRDHIEKKVDSNAAGEPNAIIFLTCDLTGVLPPVAKLNKNAAAYYFLSGYTAKLGSTETGSAHNIEPVFSTCFGAPFFPRPAEDYATLLTERIDKSGAKVYLVNTGWVGGSYDNGGKRFSLATTRAVIKAIQSGAIENSPSYTLPYLNLDVPMDIEDIDNTLLDPPATWSSALSYRSEAKKLANLFRDNFKQFEVSEDVIQSGPV